MYFPYFITYIVAGFVISLLVLFWALRNGQFREQDRARFLALDTDDTTAKTVAVSKFHHYEGLAMIALVAVGLLATVSVLIFAIAGRPH
jgi:nitrogen fixation-related uncharacterized protein